MGKESGIGRSFSYVLIAVLTVSIMLLSGAVVAVPPAKDPGGGGGGGGSSGPTTTLIYPALGEDEVPTNPTLRWNAPGADYYRIYVTSGLTTTYYSSAPSLTVSLEASRMYWWQVQASADGGTTWGPLCPTWMFETGVGPAAELTYPEDGAGLISVNPTLTWTAPFTNYHRIYVSTWTTETYYSSSPSLTLSLSGSEHYWWQVQSSEDGGATYGPLTATWDFTTWSNGIATLTYPANGATGIPTNPTLTWTGPSDANYYRIYVNGGGSPVPYYSSTASLTLALDDYRTYYWQVQASPDGGATWGDLCPTWHFDTGAAPFDGIVTLTYPGHAKTGVPVNPTTLEWTAATGANYYRIHVTGEGITNTYYTTIPSLSLSLGTGTCYWWQVQASPDGGITWGDLTATWYFWTWAPPASDWYEPMKDVRGQVFDREVISSGYLVNPLANIPVAVRWTVYVGSCTEYTQTDANGYFRVNLAYTVTSQVYVGWENTDGYWTEYRIVYSPSVGEIYALMDNGPGVLYPFQSYAHTPYCTLEYSSGAQTTIGASIDLLGIGSYSWSRTTTFATGASSLPGEGSLVISQHYDEMSGIYQSSDIFGPVEILDAWPIGDPTDYPGTAGDSLVDPYLTIPDGAPFELSYWLEPQHSGSFSATTTVLEGWSWSLKILGLDAFAKANLQVTEGTEEHISADFWNPNSVESNIYVQYVAWIEGPIMHVWQYAYKIGETGTPILLPPFA